MIGIDPNFDYMKVNVNEMMVFYDSFVHIV